MTEEEKLAEEQIKRWDNILAPVMYPVALVKDFIRKSFLAGFKAGLKAVVAKWHRIADGDLPDTDRFVLVRTQRGDIGTAWYSNGLWNSADLSGIIIAWCEIPKYTEEEEE